MELVRIQITFVLLVEEPEGVDKVEVVAQGEIDLLQFQFFFEYHDLVKRMHEEVFLFSGQNTLWGGDVRPVVAQDRSTHRVSRGFDRYHDLFKFGIRARSTIILRRFLTLISSPQILPWFLVFGVSSSARALSLIGRSPFPKAIVSTCTTIRAHRIAYSPLVFVTDILLVLL